jgi:hypothetical protein
MVHTYYLLFSPPYSIDTNEELPVLSGGNNPILRKEQSHLLWRSTKLLLLQKLFHNHFSLSSPYIPFMSTLRQRKFQETPTNEYG